MSVELKERPAQTGGAPAPNKPGAPQQKEFVPINKKGMLDLWELRHLTTVMVKRELLGQYRGSIMGVFGTMIDPLGKLLLYTFVFGIVMKVKFSTGGGISNFAFYLMAGLLPFVALSNCLERVTSLIASQPNLVKRVVFPLEILPLSLVISSMVNQVVGTVILIVVAALFGCLPHATIAFIPLIMVSQFLFMSGISWLLASLGVYLTDLRHFMSLIMQAWMYASPVFFPVSLYPQSLKFLLTINPMAGMVLDYRRVLLEGLPPDWQSFAVYTTIAVVAWFVGYYFFSKTKHSFADVI